MKHMQDANWRVVGGGTNLTRRDVMQRAVWALVAAALPGSAVVPATLAIGEKVGISGQHFTRAVALGYDIGMRAFQTVGTGPILKDTHVLVGTFGAAAAAGC